MLRLLSSKTQGRKDLWRPSVVYYIGQDGIFKGNAQTLMGSYFLEKKSVVAIKKGCIIKAEKQSDLALKY